MRGSSAMNKTDLTTIDREKEPNFYRLCEWCNTEIDKGLIDIKAGPMMSLDPNCASGWTHPESRPATRDEFAAAFMALIDAPIVPGHHPDLFT